jgi:hypothetical protein
LEVEKGGTSIAPPVVVNEMTYVCPPHCQHWVSRLRRWVAPASRGQRQMLVRRDPLGE